MVASGQNGAYEALQLYRSKVNRCKQKGDFNGAITVCCDSANCLLSHGYGTAGGEMANILIEMLGTSGQKLDVDNRQRINDIDSKFVSNGKERQDFLKQALSWSIKSGDREHGDLMLNSTYAFTLWDAGQHKKAILHFVQGEAPEKLWAKLCEKFTSATPQSDEHVQEREQLVTLAVVQFLAHDNLRDANTLMDSVKDAMATPVHSSPLLLFCLQLLMLCERDASPLYQKLCNANLASLQQCDPVVLASLQGPVAQRMFGIRPPPNILSMLEGLLGAF